MPITFQRNSKLLPKAYKYYKWSISATMSVNDGFVQASEFRFQYDGADTDMSSVAISLLNGHTSPETEQAINLKDGSFWTKFLDLNFDSGGTEVLFEFPSSITFNGYRWATANDEDSRDPKNWIIYGSNDNTNWVTLHTVTNFNSTTNRQTFNTPLTYTNGIAVDNTRSKVIFTANPPILDIIRNGLQLHLDAGNVLSYPGSGTTWTDLIGNKEFTLFNTPTYGSGNGGYLEFSPESSQYAEATSLPDSLANWTVEVWHYYNPTNMPTNSSPCIVTEVYAGNPINYTLGNCTDSSPNLQTGHWDGGSFNATPQGYSLIPNNWYHIVGTFDGTAHRLYVNGVQVTITETTSPAMRGGVGIRLMCRWDVPQFWGGKLSVVRIYNNAIGADGVSNNYEVQRTRFGL